MNTLKFQMYGKGISKLPTRATEGSAGYDLHLKGETICFDSSSPQTQVAHTGVSVEIPEGWVGLLSVRSSLHRKGICMANGVGVIDSDYRGELMVPLAPISFAVDTEVIEVGERFAQLIIIPAFLAQPVWDDLSDTERGEGGFGSTGQ